MIALVTPANPLGELLSDLRLILEVIAAVFAMRVYRHQPSKPLWLLQCGFLILAVTHVATFSFSGVMLFVFRRIMAYHWLYYVDAFAVIVFLCFSILGLRFMQRDASASHTRRSNHAPQPTADRSDE